MPVLLFLRRIIRLIPITICFAAFGTYSSYAVTPNYAPIQKVFAST
jgi:hypothetical protein